MARVYVAHKKDVCLVLNTWEKLAALGINPTVVKHLFNGKSSAAFISISISRSYYTTGLSYLYPTGLMG